ncbi:hypothetical protein CGCTS75_v006604 [Colletotrichum tropicale]|nr:hypothetical protein CGCTS75_v006604 [Colletotrichum tropicale]
MTRYGLREEEAEGRNRNILGLGRQRKCHRHILRLPARTGGGTWSDTIPVKIPSPT